MDSTFLYFLSGLAVFGVKRAVEGQGETIRRWLYPAAGSAASFIIALIGGYPLSSVADLPPVLALVSGAAAGYILYLAEERRYFTTGMIKYVATIVLGLALGLAAFIVAWGYSRLTGGHVFRQITIQYKAITFFVYGFMTVFGYIFPERWFIRRRIDS